MNKLVKLSLALVVSLMVVGCGNSSKSSEKPNVSDTQIVQSSTFDKIESLGHSIMRGSSSNKSLVFNKDKSGFKDEKSPADIFNEGSFMVDSSYDSSSTPIVIDQKGNILKGGFLQYLDEDKHKVVIEVTENNVVLYKIDINNDNLFSDSEVRVEKFDGGIYGELPIEGSNKSIYGTSLEEILNAKKGESAYVDENKLIDIIIIVKVPEPNIVDNETHNISSSNDSFGNSSYFDNGMEVTKEELEEIEKKINNEKKEYYKLQKDLNREALRKIFEDNNLEINESMQFSLDEGKDTFEIQFTKSEIKTFVDKNRDFILGIELQPTGYAE